MSWVYPRYVVWFRVVLVMWCLCDVGGVLACLDCGFLACLWIVFVSAALGGLWVMFGLALVVGFGGGGLAS